MSNSKNSVLSSHKNVHGPFSFLDRAPSADWPKQGRIVFSNVYLFYGDHPVLQGINCEIKPGEKASDSIVFAYYFFVN